MLSDLFRLDGTPTIIPAAGNLPPMSPGDVVANTVFAPGEWKPPGSKVKDVTFRSVAFSKTKISQVTFIGCTFVDCLFTGAHMSEVEFHGCTFTDCNFWKIRLARVYLRPDTIKFADRYRAEGANIGISIYQAMLSNFAEERQDHFYMLADIEFRRWKRYQIRHDRLHGNKTSREARLEWVSSVIYETLAGFGYRPLRFFFATIVLFLSVSCLNYFAIGGSIQVGTAPPNVPSVHASFVDTIFYSFSVLTVLGFSLVTPTTDGAKILTVLEALASIGWLGIFTAVLVKRFLR